MCHIVNEARSEERFDLVQVLLAKHNVSASGVLHGVRRGARAGYRGSCPSLMENPCESELRNRDATIRCEALQLLDQRKVPIERLRREQTLVVAHPHLSGTPVVV